MRHKGKHLHTKQTPFSVWILRCAALLGCLTLLSVYMLSGVYSKFHTDAAGRDSARVAHFSPSFVAESVAVSDKKPGYSAEIAFDVRNFSGEKLPETAMQYAIVLKTTGNIPLQFTLLDDSKHAVKTWVCSGTDGECVYTYADSALVFSASVRQTDAYTLKLEWPGDKNDARFSGMTDAVYLSVEFEQID